MSHPELETPTRVENGSNGPTVHTRTVNVPRLPPSRPKAKSNASTSGTKASSSKTATPKHTATQEVTAKAKPTNVVKADPSKKPKIKPDAKSDAKPKVVNSSAKPATKPLAKAVKEPATKPATKPAASKSSSRKRVKDEADKDESAGPAKRPKIKSSQDSAADRTPKSESPEPEDDDEYKWWEEAHDNDGTKKWDTLAHSGVMFPPAYEPLPKGVHLVYDGKPVALPLVAEEVAGFFGALLETDYAKNEIFVKNFFDDLKQVLVEAKEAGQEAKTLDLSETISIENYDKCDFTVIHKHIMQQNEARRALPPSEKKRIREEKLVLEEKFRFCTIDGRKQPVGNFRIEPPGLFRGRGNHPKTGKLKRRVAPEEITINIGKGEVIPPPPEGRDWAKVQHDNCVEWLASWTENINGNAKYVRLAANSSLKGKSDLKKFEKARQLKGCINKIRKDYHEKLTSTSMVERQRATATYLIDVLALRAGGEKSEDEADTVGCCSLRCEHLTLEEPNLVTFDFLGKDSVRFYQQVKVDRQVFLNLGMFTRSPKLPADDVFDKLDTDGLNRHLRSYMDGLSAKVFRTYNASQTMQQQLDKIPVKNDMTVQEKVISFNSANRAVAILCNHQRNVGKSHDAAVEKGNERIEEMIWQRIRLKNRLLAVDPELKKKRRGFFTEVKSMKIAQLKAVAKRICQKEREKQQTKFNRAQEKHTADPKNNPRPTKVDLKQHLQAINATEREYLGEIADKAFAADCKLSTRVEKLDEQIKRLDARISAATLVLQDKQDNSSVALTTSKINYIDPRLTATFSKRHDVPIEKLFTKTLREKFMWAIESVDKNWRF